MIRYRVVHVAQSVASEARLPIAAMVENLRGTVDVVRAPKLPAACMGERSLGYAVDALLDVFTEATGLDELPPVLGPMIHVGPKRPVPASEQESAAKWVQRFVLGVGRPKGDKVVAPAGKMRRDTAGAQFFRRHRVEQFVRHRFTADKAVELARAEPVVRLPELAPITHWVLGDEALFLMEPVLPRSRTTIRQTSTRLIAYRQVSKLLEAELQRKITVLAYLLPGGSLKSRLEAMDTLDRATDRAVNTVTDEDRSWLVSAVRRVGESGMPEGRLTH